MIKDSGKREEFETGAVRDAQDGKGRCDLLPLDCLPNKYATDPVLLLLNEFKKYGKPSFVENAREYFIRKAFPNVETSLLELAIHYEEGAKKYGDNNWQKGLPASRYISSAIRHYVEYCRGDNDEPHARAVIWNLTAIIWTCKHKPELNDYANIKVTVHQCGKTFPEYKDLAAELKPPIKNLPNVQIVCVSTPTTRDYEAREKFFSDMVNFIAEPLKPELKGGVK